MSLGEVASSRRVDKTSRHVAGLQRAQLRANSRWASSTIQDSLDGADVDDTRYPPDSDDGRLADFDAADDCDLGTRERADRRRRQ